MRLEQPITVNGTICRADWVDGVSTRCRDTTEGGKKREEDWKPSHCSICAVFEASPCSEIFSKRYRHASVILRSVSGCSMKVCGLVFWS